VAALALPTDPKGERRKRWTGEMFEPRHMINWVNRPLLNDERVACLRGHVNTIYAIGVTEEYIISAGSQGKNKRGEELEPLVYLWQRQSGETKGLLKLPHKTTIRSLAVNVSGEYLATGVPLPRSCPYMVIIDTHPRVPGGRSTPPLSSGYHSRYVLTTRAPSLPASLPVRFDGRYRCSL